MLNRAFSNPGQASNDDVAAMVRWVFGGFGRFSFLPLCVCVSGGLLWCGFFFLFCLFFEREVACVVFIGLIFSTWHLMQCFCAR